MHSHFCILGLSPAIAQRGTRVERAVPGREAAFLQPFGEKEGERENKVLTSQFSALNAGTGRESGSWTLQHRIIRGIPISGKPINCNVKGS
jgi:hypothetical protein